MYTYQDKDVYDCPFSVETALDAHDLKSFQYNAKGEVVTQKAEKDDLLYDPAHCTLFYKD